MIQISAEQICTKSYVQMVIQTSIRTWFYIRMPATKREIWGRLSLLTVVTSQPQSRACHQLQNGIRSRSSRGIDVNYLELHLRMYARIAIANGITFLTLQMYYFEEKRILNRRLRLNYILTLIIQCLESNHLLTSKYISEWQYMSYWYKTIS